MSTRTEKAPRSFGRTLLYAFVSIIAIMLAMVMFTAIAALLPAGVNVGVCFGLFVLSLALVAHSDKVTASAVRLQFSGLVAVIGAAVFLLRVVLQIYNLG